MRQAAAANMDRAAPCCYRLAIRPLALSTSRFLSSCLRAGATSGRNSSDGGRAAKREESSGQRSSSREGDGNALDLLAVAVVADTGRGLTLAAVFDRANANDVRVDGARDAVVDLEVQLGQRVLAVDRRVREVADCGRLDHVAHGEALDSLVLGHAAAAVAAAHRLDVACNSTAIDESATGRGGQAGKRSQGLTAAVLVTPVSTSLGRHSCCVESRLWAAVVVVGRAFSPLTARCVG